MKGIVAIFTIAFCLLPNTSEGAELGEEKITKKNSKSAEKVLAIMSKFGVSGSNVKEAAYFVDERMDGEKFRIHKGSYEGFNLTMQFNTEKLKTEGFEMRLTNDSMPNWEVKGTSEEVMLNYKIEW